MKLKNNKRNYYIHTMNGKYNVDNFYYPFKCLPAYNFGAFNMALTTNVPCGASLLFVQATA